MPLPVHLPLPALAEPAFDWFARRTAQLLATPMALVSLVNVDGQVMPGAYGIPEPWATDRATPLTHSWCRYVVESGRPFLLPDAGEHPVFTRSAARNDLGMIAYLGVPLTHAGRTVGALSAIDDTPRHWTSEHVADLRQLAAVCTDLLRRRLSH